MPARSPSVVAAEAPSNTPGEPPSTAAHYPARAQDPRPCAVQVACRLWRFLSIAPRTRTRAWERVKAATPGTLHQGSVFAWWSSALLGALGAPDRRFRAGCGSVLHGQERIHVGDRHRWGEIEALHFGHADKTHYRGFRLRPYGLGHDLIPRPRPRVVTAWMIAMARLRSTARAGWPFELDAAPAGPDAAAVPGDEEAGYPSAVGDCVHLPCDVEQWDSGSTWNRVCGSPPPYLSGRAERRCIAREFDGGSEQIALGEFAPHRRERFGRRPVFNAFGRHFET